MARIVAARAESQSESQSMVAGLTAAGFPRDGISMFFVTPAGQHALHPLGGDAGHDEGSKETGKGAAAGIGVGAAGGAVLGGVLAAAAPVTAVGAVAVAAAAAAAGAYTGSLVSGMNATRSGDPQAATTDEPVSRKAGMLVGVQADDDDAFQRALQVLRDHGGLELETAEGTIRGGDWIDFDPRLPPRLVEGHTTSPFVAGAITRGDEAKGR